MWYFNDERIRFRVRREASRVYVEFFIENLTKLRMGKIYWNFFLFTDKNSIYEEIV